MSFTEDGSAGSRGLGIAVRGVNNLATEERAVINSIGVYLDGFSVASIPSQVANPFLPDMERVEVLRGPQGTYFGRNSLGGALNLTSRQPTDDFGGRILVGGESYENAGEQFNVTGILNVPVSDRLKLRGVVYYEDSGGFVDNICGIGASATECPAAFANGFAPSGAADSGHEYFMGRLKALWDVTDQTTVGVTVIYANEDQGHDENVPSGILDIDTVNTFLLEEAVDPGTGFWPDNRNELSHDIAEFNKLETLVAVLNIEHRFSEHLVLKSITGIIDAEQQRLFDNDLMGGVDSIRRDNFFEGLSWSTELRLESSTDAMDWVIGFMYSEDDQKQENFVHTGPGLAEGHAFDGFTVLLPPFPADIGLAFNHKDFEVTSVALFADLTWHAAESLSLFAGARYTHDEVVDALEAFGVRPSCCFPFSPEFPGPPGFAFFQSFINVENPPANGDRTFNDFSPRFGFRYAVTEDASVYGIVSKGYKAGGTSLGNSPEIGSPAYARLYNEETVWNYELGLKSEWFDRRLRVNGSVFYLEWDDMQFNSFLALRPGPAAPVVEQRLNIESAEAIGFEVELLAAPTDHLTISAALGYLDTEIKSDTSVLLTGGFDVSLRGLDTPKAPELTASVVADYRWPIGGNELWAQLEFIHRDGQYSDIEALTNLQTRGPSPVTRLERPVGPGEFPYRTPDYDLFNIRAGFDTNRWSFTAYIQNLTDEEYYTGTQENFGASGIRLRPHPRIFGASLSYQFGAFD